MSWFYAEDGKQIGPVDDDQWASLISSGKVSADTLVWQNGMTDWVPFGTLPAAQAVSAPTVATGAAAVATQVMAGGTSVECSECHRTFPSSDVVTIGNRPVCASCKPIVVQKLAEGVLPAGDMKYAGFWIRAGAKIIDTIILWVVGQGIAMAVNLIAGGASNDSQAALMMAFGLGGANLIFSAAYQAWFLGRFAATPGKMACGLRVIRPEGEPVTYLRGAGRYFAEIISGMIFCIGYIMVAFDDEKRALHDRICDTRVVRK